jgi:uncharacterized protein HemY
VQEIGKLLFISGLVMAAAGLVLWKTGVIGRLPGDISVERPGMSFYFPITTCILISVIITLLMWLFRR